MNRHLHLDLLWKGLCLAAVATLCWGCASPVATDTAGPAGPAAMATTAASPIARAPTETVAPRPSATASPAPTATATVLAPMATGSPAPTATSSPAPTATASPAPTATAAPAAYDWLQFNFDPQHSGNNPRETVLGPGNVASLKRVFRVSLPAIADGAPAYLSGVETPSGRRDLLFLTTKAGHILALDAHSGEQVWMHQYPAGSCRINLGSQPCYTTSSPAIDPDRQYVYSYGLDGQVHKYQVGDGTEVTTGGWPALTTRKPYNEKGSSALSQATATDGTAYLYMTNGGYLGDRGDYQGHVTAINLADGSQQVFNTNCSDQAVHFVEKPGQPDCPAVQSAVWARAGVVYDPATDLIYFATGNGTFDPARYDWGDSVLAVHPDGSGAGGNPVDSYTPADYQRLQNRDLDLGSTAPAILPVPAGGTVAHLGLQGGKDAVLRLLDLENLSGQGGPGRTGGEVQVLTGVAHGDIFTAPAVWVDPANGTTWVFLVDPQAISGLRLGLDSSGTPRLEQAWVMNGGGSSPIVANGVVYYAGGRGIRALDPTSGQVLWQDTSLGGIHWESPIVANGVLYITDERGDLMAYAP